MSGYKNRITQVEWKLNLILKEFDGMVDCQLSKSIFEWFIKIKEDTYLTFFLTTEKKLCP